MPNLSPPRTQYNRNITFRLTGGGPPVVFTFPIKPEEFERSSPARNTTTQTLGGIYQDLGGLGITTIRIQGNTGWRRKINGADNTGMDGFEAMRMLYTRVYQEYNRRVSLSVDPEKIELLLIDDLHDEVYRVSMDDFQASKSNTKSLLYNYTIPMTVQSSTSDNRTPHDLSQLPSIYLDSNYIPISLMDMMNEFATYKPSINRTYTVQQGDSLGSISYAYFGTTSRANEIASLNSLATPYRVTSGQILKIPW